MRDADGHFLATEFYSGDQSRRRAHARPAAHFSRPCHRSRRSVHRDGDHILERRSCSGSRCPCTKRFHRPGVSSRTREHTRSSCRAVRPCPSQRLRLATDRSPVLTSHSRITSAPWSGERLRHFAISWNLLPAGRVQQHDAQPRFGPARRTIHDDWWKMRRRLCASRGKVTRVAIHRSQLVGQFLLKILERRDRRRARMLAAHVGGHLTVDLPLAAHLLRHETGLSVGAIVATKIARFGT